ncbi:hypothetical protein [Streptomyces sp. SID13031]|uniref:hypothetical protein n=1 Tax=Streptomyces sp. SID13031 TaxID=2706046 RepID=UPI0013C80C22|nr:hypothetical protein [Streptomyces sp. SID13031]NEA33389.1 hypothetical protein [Streptomyces sp. SID13031]
MADDAAKPDAVGSGRRGHLGIPVAVVVPAVAIFQISSLAGYDMQVSLAILSATESTANIAISAGLVSLQFFGTIIAGIACSFLLISHLGVFGGQVASTREIELLEKYSPMFLGLLILAVFVTPWILLSILLAESLLLALYVAYHERDRGSRPVRAASTDVRKRSGRAMLITVLAIFPLLSTNNTWIPYEELTTTGLQSFTGQVVGSKNDELIVVTSGRRIELMRLPVQKTQRALCARTKLNTRVWPQLMFGTDQLFYGRSVVQVALGIRGAELKPCPARNHPTD